MNISVHFATAPFILQEEVQNYLPKIWPFKGVFSYGIKSFILMVAEYIFEYLSQHLFMIIKVTDKKEAEEANFEKRKDEISDILFDQKLQTEYSTWMQELYQKYKIENSLTGK